MTEDELQQFADRYRVQYCSTEDGDRHAIVDADHADMTGWKVRVAPTQQRLGSFPRDRGAKEVQEFTRGDVGYFFLDGIWGPYGYGGAEWRYPWVASVDHDCEIVEWIPPGELTTQD